MDPSQCSYQSVAPLQQNEAFVANKYIYLSTELTEITYSLGISEQCSQQCTQTAGPTFQNLTPTICSCAIVTTLPCMCGDRYRPGLAEEVQFSTVLPFTLKKAVEGQYASMKQGLISSLEK